MASAFRKTRNRRKAVLLMTSAVRRSIPSLFEGFFKRDEGLPGADQRARAMTRVWSVAIPSNEPRYPNSALQDRQGFGYIPPAFRSG
jgi:hypothetical protein